MPTNTHQLPEVQARIKRTSKRLEEGSMDYLLNSSVLIAPVATKQECSIELAEVSAAATLVGFVRMLLVILICVLLIKLRSPPNNKHRVLGQPEEAEQDEAEKEGQTIVASKLYTRILIKISKLINILLRLGGQIELANEQTSTNALATKLNGRRKSQPIISSSSSTGPEVLLNKRRRFSDTSLAHLSLPPGPMGLPFLGYLPFVGREIHLTLSDLSDRYGPIYQIFLGGIRVVVLNDAALVRQAFKQPVFSGRPDTQLTRILQGYGIVNSDGALWREQRAFLHTALRKLGAKSLMSGTNGLEAKIQVSVQSHTCFEFGAV